MEYILDLEYNVQNTNTKNPFQKLEKINFS